MNHITKEQQQAIFSAWARYKPTEQKMMIDEYLRLNTGACSKEKFLIFLRDRIFLDNGVWKEQSLCSRP